MSKKITADVAIIGAGIIGCNIALELNKLGVRNVAVFDRFPCGAGSGTTSYSSAIVRCFYSVPDMIHFSWESYQVWLNWADHLGVVLDEDGRVPACTPGFPAAGASVPAFYECGACLLRTPTASTFIDEQLPNYEKVGIKYSLLDYAETEDLVGRKLGWDISKSYVPRRMDDAKFDEPVEGAKVTGSLWIPETGYVSDPRLAAQNVAAAAKARGTEFYFGADVTAIHQEGGAIRGLKLKDGTEVSCPVVVNAAGPFSASITALAYPSNASGPLNDMTIKPRALRAEVAILEPPPGVDMKKDGLITADFDLGFYLKPEAGGRMLVGSIDPECDPHQYVEQNELENMDTALGDMYEHCIYRAALRMPEMPIPNSRSTRGAVSTYDVSEDWQPVLDKSNIEGFYMAIGTSGNCFKVSPVIGQVMAALIKKTEDSRAASQGERFDHDATPLQMPLPLIGQTLNVGAFSRLRKLHKTTAGVIG